jgi:hypothetical protein
VGRRDDGGGNRLGVGSGACLLLIVTRSFQFRRLRPRGSAPAAVVRQTRSVARGSGSTTRRLSASSPGRCPMLYAFVGNARLLLPRGLWEG